MSNANRDAQGRWSSANIQGHTPSTTPLAGGANISSGTDPAQRGAASSIASQSGDPHAQAAPVFSSAADPAARGAASSTPDGSKDDWGAPSQTGKLLNRPTLRGAGAAGVPMAPPPVRDYSAAYRSMGYSANESAGQHQVRTSQGAAQNGRDIPGSGVPGPTDPGDSGGVPGTGAETGAGAAEATGAAAGLEELAPLALAL